MKTYSVLFAQDVSHYATAEISAASNEEATEKARSYPNIGDLSFEDPDWNNPVCLRIIHIEDADGKLVADDIPLDDFFLRGGGEPDRKLCNASAEMLTTLRLAKNPHWVHNAGITDDIEALRKICLYYCEWWNTQAWPLIRELSLESEIQGVAA